MVGFMWTLLLAWAPPFGAAFRTRSRHKNALAASVELHARHTTVKEERLRLEEVVPLRRRGVEELVEVSSEGLAAAWQQFVTGLTADFGDVYQAIGKTDFSTFFSRPHELAGLLFSLLIILHSIRVLCFEWLSEAALTQKRNGYKKSRAAFYHGPLNEMMTELNALRNTPAFPAEVHFQCKHRDLMTFLHNISKHKMLYNADSKLVEPFREFMIRWLAVFEQCSPDPEGKPYIVCSKDKIDRASSIATITKTICKEAMGNQPALAGPVVNTATTLHRDCTQKSKSTKDTRKRQQPWLRPVCGVTITWKRREANQPYPLDVNIGCMKLTVLGGRHLFMLLLLLLGTGLAAALHATSRHFTGLCVDGALCLIVAILLNTEAVLEQAQLHEEEAILAEQAADTQRYTKSLAKWREKYERNLNLWQYQTMHMLDLFAAVSAVILFSSSREYEGANAQRVEEPLREILSVLNKKLEVVIEGMGTPSFYLDSGFVHGDWWPDVNEHIQKSIGTIREVADLGEVEEMARQLESFFGLIVVRVMGANNLPNTDAGVFAKSGDLTDGFVLVRLANQKREDAPFTGVIHDNLSPRWEEEFCLMVRDEHHLTLEVFDSQDDSWMAKSYMASSTQEIGFVRLHFRNKPGQWVKQEQKLRTFQYGKQMESSLEFEFFFANCIQHLTAMETEDDGAQSLQSIGAFLSAVPSVRETTSLR